MFFKKLTFTFLILLPPLLISTTDLVVANSLSMVVIDAKNGQELFKLNNDQKRPPASLTKMMTLYLTFYAVEKIGNLKLDQRVKVSRNASNEPPSKLGLKSGQTETIRNLIRSAALKSANDSATVLAEAISGSEKEFAQYMTRSAKLMGMSDTQFKNAHGLTEEGHYSTASDMAKLARRLYFDFPDYYHLFGKDFIYVSGQKIKNTNWKFLNSYLGADGIKTGFTNAAGFSLAASAERGSERVIGVILGAKGSGERTKRMGEMLNMGFANLEKSPFEDSLLPINLQEIRTQNLAEHVKVENFPPSRNDISFIVTYEKSFNNANFSNAKRPRIFLEPGSQELNQSLINLLENSYENYSLNKDHSIQVGFYYTKANAQGNMTKVIISTMDTLMEIETEIVVVVKESVKGYSLQFKGLTAAQAMKSCARIRVIDIACTISIE